VDRGWAPVGGGRPHVPDVGGVSWVQTACPATSHHPENPLGAGMGGRRGGGAVVGTPPGGRPRTGAYPLKIGVLGPVDPLTGQYASGRFK